MFSRHRSDVLVVGAGPVGLYAALLLAERGVRVEILDKHRRTGAHSYALALHPRSLRIFEELGLAQGIVKLGRRIDRIGFWENGRLRGSVSIGEIGGTFPYVLVVPQHALEEHLESRLAAAKVKVRWNHRLDGLRVADEELVAEVSQLDQVASGYPIARLDWSVVKTYRAQTHYLIGADGYHSQVRERMGLRFEPKGGLETFSVFELECAEDPGNEVRVLFDGNLTSVLWPMTEDRCRWSFQISHPDQHEPNLGRLNAFLKARAPWFPPARGEVYWSSMVQFDRRLASRMGRERVWLAGDSAHLTSPVGVQSMNAGIVDAHELAALLARIVVGDGRPELLESYNAERLRELRALFDPARLQAGPEAEEWVPRLASRILPCLPCTGRDLEILLAQFGLKLLPAAEELKPPAR